MSPLPLLVTTKVAGLQFRLYLHWIYQSTPSCPSPQPALFLRASLGLTFFILHWKWSQWSVLLGRNWELSKASFSFQAQSLNHIPCSWRWGWCCTFPQVPPTQEVLSARWDRDSSCRSSWFAPASVEQALCKLVRGQFHTHVDRVSVLWLGRRGIPSTPLSCTCLELRSVYKGQDEKCYFLPSPPKKTLALQLGAG